MKTYHVDWYGPFSKYEIGNDLVSRIGFKGNGLYLVTGKGSNRQNKPELKYVGITERDYAARFDPYHTLNNIIHPELWLGRVYGDIENKRQALEDAEHMLIYFSDYKLKNVKKTASPPKEDITVLSNWFSRDVTCRKRHASALVDFADVLIWYSSEQRLRYAYRLHELFC